MKLEDSGMGDKGKEGTAAPATAVGATAAAVEAA